VDVVEDLSPGDPETIGPYKLLGSLGSGGMGRVYLARSLGGRLIAVKMIRPELAAEPGFRIRFKGEVEAARRVNGLYTAVVVDADTDAPLPWLATGYVAGPSLYEAVERHGPLPAQTVLKLAAALAEGLQAIHAAGIVHRDLKPSNVLIANDGPRVIDFGISRALEGISVTDPGMVMGSPGYLSPEQAGGDPVGPQSDMFSLGSVLTYAAVGTGPFGSGQTPALMFRVVSRDPDLSQVPDEVCQIVSPCLAKDPDRRPTPAELLDHLGSLDVSANWLPDDWLGASQDRAPAEPPTVSGRPRAASYAVKDPTRVANTQEQLVDPDTVTTRAEFGKALSTVRQIAGLTARQVADEIGQPVTTIRAYFGGRSLPANHEALRAMLRACGVFSGVVKWEMALVRVRDTPRPPRAESGTSRPRASQARLLDGDQPDLLLRVYIPSERLYATQTSDLLAMFRDWLAARWKGIRQSGYHTKSGETIEFFADAASPHPVMREEFDVFMNFLRLSASTPDTAVDMLASTELDKEQASDLVTRFGKQYRRLQVDLRHERERRIMTLRHTLEGELLETGVDLRAIPAGQIGTLLENLVPGSSIPSWLPSLTGSRDSQYQPMNVTVHANQVVNAQQVMNAMTYAVIENVQGSIHLSTQAKELLSVIDKYAGQESAGLRTALHELEDQQAPITARSAALGKLKAFLAQVVGKLPDAGIAVMEKYLESKLGLKG
jgi:serine/threonine protein kinase